MDAAPSQTFFVSSDRIILFSTLEILCLCVLQTEDAENLGQSKNFTRFDLCLKNNVIE